MIEKDLSADQATGRFVLRPQRSATWRQNLWLLAAIAAVALPLAIGWAIVGFWLILPLAILQLGVVLVAFWVSSYSLLAREVVTIGPEQIVIEAGHREPERRFELTRYWSQVRLREGSGRMRRRQLIIQSRECAVECGRFLNEAEREALWRDLRAVLAHRAPPGRFTD